MYLGIVNLCIQPTLLLVWQHTRFSWLEVEDPAELTIEEVWVKVISEIGGDDE